MITFEGEATIAKTPKTTDNKDESGSTSFLVTATWKPSIGAAWDFTTRCFFDEVTLTLTIEEGGDLLTDASGSFTRTGSTCRNPDTPVPFVLGELRRQ